MCTIATSSKYLQRPMIAYAVRYKNPSGSYSSPYFNNNSYMLDKRYRAGTPYKISINNKKFERIYAGYFHMFLTYKDARDAKKKMHPYMHSRTKLRFKIVKIKIYSRQRVYFGHIPLGCQNHGKETVCANSIVHLEEATLKKH